MEGSCKNLESRTSPCSHLMPLYFLEEMATHSSFLAWRDPWTEEPGGLQSVGSQVSHDWSVLAHMHSCFMTVPGRPASVVSIKYQERQPKFKMREWMHLRFLMRRAQVYQLNILFYSPKLRRWVISDHSLSDISKWYHSLRMKVTWGGDLSL